MILFYEINQNMILSSKKDDSNPLKGRKGEFRSCRFERKNLNRVAMMIAKAVLKRMNQIGVVPVVRVDMEKEAFEAVNALTEGGIPIAEITMTTPNARQIIAKLIHKFGNHRTH